MTKISVIIPVYNVEKYLSQCLDSIINQTLTDIEIICINDGSTDNSLKILEEYTQKDNRIKILSQENSGPGIARNYGISIACGEYLSFIDPDDWIDLDYYEKLYSKAKENNWDIVKTNFVEFVNGYYRPVNTMNKAIKNKQVQQPLWRIFKSEHQTAIYKTELLKKHNIRYGASRISEDTTFLIKVAFFSNNITVIDNTSYIYRRTVNSLSNNRNLNFYIHILKSIEEKIDFWSSVLTENNQADIFEEILFYFNWYNHLYAFMYKDKTKIQYSEELFNYWAGLIDKIKNKNDFIQFAQKHRLLKILINKDYSDFINYIKIKVFRENLFSITNEYINFKKYKIITILGIKIKFKEKL